MFKKLLIATLTCLSFVSLTACGSGKKLTEDEAKVEIKAAQENTAKAIKEKKGLTVKQTYNAKADINAKNVKIGEGQLALNIDTVKLGLDVNEAIEANVDLIDKEAKIKGDINTKLNYELNGNDEKLKKELIANGNAEVYVKNGKEKTNIYAKGTATLPEKDELLRLLGVISFFYEDALELGQKIENSDYKTNLDGKINIRIDKDDDEEKDITELISEFDFSTLIKDWSIFSKKGSTLTADCSNIEALNIDITNEDVQELASYGLNLKVSKFEIKLGKNNEIKNFDFKISLDGKVDLGKITSTTTDSESMFDNISGTVSVDTSFGFNFNVEYQDSATAVLVPDELAKRDEYTIEDIFTILFSQNPEMKIAEIKARNVYNKAKDVLTSAASGGVAYKDIKFDINTMTYTLTVNDLIKLGEILENPFDANDYSDGGMTVTYAQYDPFIVIIQGKINGYSINIDQEGNITVFEAK